MPGRGTMRDGQRAVELRPHHTRPRGGQPCPGRVSVVPETPAEMAACIRAAEGGNAPPSWPHHRAAAARRVAELLELAGADQAAVPWWRRAADLGDPDAIDYVAEILPGTAHAKAQRDARETGVSGFDDQGFCKPGTAGRGRHVGEPLTGSQIAALPDGAEVVITWFGGNGPAPYRILVDAWGERRVETCYADPILRGGVRPGDLPWPRVTRGWDEDTRRWAEERTPDPEHIRRQWRRMRAGTQEGS
jgi:hypothetical protein